MAILWFECLEWGLPSLKWVQFSYFPLNSCADFAFSDQSNARIVIPVAKYLVELNCFFRQLMPFFHLSCCKWMLLERINLPLKGSSAWAMEMSAEQFNTNGPICMRAVSEFALSPLLSFNLLFNLFRPPPHTLLVSAILHFEVGVWRAARIPEAGASHWKKAKRRKKIRK